MSSPRLLSLVLLVALLASPNIAGVASAEPDQELPRNDAHTMFLKLRKEYLQICKNTKRDSPEFRVAIEQTLATFRERGGTDDFELTLRRELGRSYRIAGEFSKSTEILTAVLGKGDDPDAKAYDLLVIAQNARDSKDVDTATKFLEEAVAKYPNTGAGQTALAELDKPLYGHHLADSTRSEKKSWKGISVGANLAVIAVLVTIFIRRQIKKRSRLAS